MLTTPGETDVLVLGAGPAGSVASALLAGNGRRVLCVERGYFPRHTIGESLLPRSNQLLEAAGLWGAVEARGYQQKRGAVFLRGAERERFCFADGLSGEPAYTYQVPRADFDQTLASGARARGAEVRFGLEVTGVAFDGEGRARASLRDVETGEASEVAARFVIDASGAGRVLPRLLGLERPAGLGERAALFTMIEGDARPGGDEAGDIWVGIDAGRSWSWIIPFSDGRTSVGVVADRAALGALDHQAQQAGPAGRALHDRARLWSLLQADPNAARRLAGAVPVMRTGRLEAWSGAVERLSGQGYAIAGNAGEFLDPVFSSGVTLALESGSLAARLCERQLAGEAVAWQAEYDEVVRGAVAVFRAFVEGWYRGDVPRIFFARHKVESVKRFITSILAGHVLDPRNPLARSPEASLRRLLRAVDASSGGAPPELV
jgi:flavin-dependent dehydrogenase